MTQGRTTSCPRCAGRMVAASDWLSRYLTCLMCGFVDEPTRIEVGQARWEAEREDRTVRLGGRA